MDLQDRAKKQAEDVLLAGRSMGVTQAAAEMRWDSHVRFQQLLVLVRTNTLWFSNMAMQKKLPQGNVRAMAVARL